MLAKDCGADITKFCKGLNLGNNAIRNCLDGNQASVSPTCTSTLVAVTGSIERRLAAQASVMKVCSGNAKTYCTGVKGEVYILQCLVKTERIDSGKCNQAITDSGLALSQLSQSGETAMSIRLFVQRSGPYGGAGNRVRPCTAAQR